MTRSGIGRQRAGHIDTDPLVLKLWPPERTGPDAGTRLHASALCSWYAEILLRVLERAGLPVTSLNVTASGTLTGAPNRMRLALVAFSPTIVGGDARRLEEYNEAAHRARERCFIGGSFGPGVVYDVRPVRIWESMT